MQKIIYVVTKSNFGGAQKYVYELSTEAKSQNFDVSVILGGNGTLKEKLTDANIKTFSIPEMDRNINPIRDVVTFIKITKIFFRENPTVIHLNSSKAGALGTLAGRVSNLLINISNFFKLTKNKNPSAKIIFTIHGWAFNENRSILSRILIKKIYWLTIFLSHKSIAVSEKTKEQAKQIYFHKIIFNKIIVIKNAIKPIEFLDRNAARNNIAKIINSSVTDENIIIGCLAELHKIKGLEYLIDAAEKIIDYNKKYIFIVFGQGEEYDLLKKLISSKKLENNFFLAGFVRNASTYMRGFDIYTSTSISEGLSLVLLEAKQAGINIICTNVGGNPEAVGNYKNKILINSKSPDEIVDAIKYFEKNRKITTEPTLNNPTQPDDFAKMFSTTISVYN